MRLQSNGGKILITHKAQGNGYKPHLWLDQKSITTIIALNNLIKKYCVTYYTLDEMFILCREEHGKKNMHFRMHERGSH